mmetsp:Transcript_2933/g.11879  ORF Transcript_2933/g.11879 Transcript_2933/m.11879 type:complete len:454 (+) Transcript_2933:1196-2557(+)
MDDSFNDGVSLESLRVTDHSEVEVAQLAVRRGQQVSRMRICVEEARVEDLPQAALHEGLDERIAVDPLRGQLLLVHEAGALDPLHGQHLGRRVVWVHTRDEDIRETSVELRKPRGVRRLCAVVDLSEDELPEVVDHADQVDVAIQRLQRIGDHARVPTQDEQVQLDDVFTVGPLDLHGDQRSVRTQPGLVHLANTRRGHRPRLHELKHLLEVLTRLPLELLEGHRLREGWNLILQLLQLLQVQRGEQVGPGGQRLARLDDRGSEARQNVQELRGALRPASLLFARGQVGGDVGEEPRERHEQLHIPEQPPKRLLIQLLLGSIRVIRHLRLRHLKLQGADDVRRRRLLPREDQLRLQNVLEALARPAKAATAPICQQVFRRGGDAPREAGDPRSAYSGRAEGTAALDLQRHPRQNQRQRASALHLALLRGPALRSRRLCGRLELDERSNPASSA